MAEMDPHHGRKRAAMSYVGVGLLLIGLACVLIGGVMFVSVIINAPRDLPHGNISRHGTNAVLGVLLMGAGGIIGMSGLSLLGFAHHGKIARYQAGEILPVAKDAVRNVQPLARDVVRDLAGAMRQGLDAPAETAGRIRHDCGTYNDRDDRFCKGCGQALGSVHCRQCGAANDADARFCDKCGHALAR